MKKDFLTVLSGLLLAGFFCMALLPQAGYAASGLHEHAVSSGSDPVEVPDTEPDPLPEDPPVQTPDTDKSAAQPPAAD